MGISDQTPSISGATDETLIGNISDSLKTNITNSTGASAVNIQDGGNSITTDNTSQGSPTGGTAGTTSDLVGGKYNTSLPTLANGQQSSIQLDQNGRVLVANSQVAIANLVLTSKLRVEPTFTTIAVTNTVTYTTLYTYTGSGQLVGFNLEFSANRAVVKVVVDGEIVMDGNSTNTLNGLYAASNNTARLQLGGGLVTQASNLDFSFRWPIIFTTSIEISARLDSGASLNLNRGIYYVQKDT